MILVAGGTGTLGTRVVEDATAAGMDVRVLTRRAERAAHLTGVDVQVGDLRDAGAVEAAARGCSAVVAAVQGFAGTEPVGARVVDVDGTRNLLRAAETAGCERFILTSATGAAPDAELMLRRVKYEAEELVRASGLAWTIIRPTVYVETWRMLLAGMAAKKGAVTVFGRGNNPINFVSASDVSALVVRAVNGTDLSGQVLEIGGPENLTLNELARLILAAAGREGGAIKHVPLPVMRASAAMLRPIKATVSAMIRFGITMDTTDMTLARDTAREAVPDLPFTSPRAVAVQAPATD